MGVRGEESLFDFVIGEFLKEREGIVINYNGGNEIEVHRYWGTDSSCEPVLK